MKKLKETFLEEIIMEDYWFQTRRFIKEIEEECGKPPVNVILASQNLILKWAEYVIKN